MKKIIVSLFVFIFLSVSTFGYAFNLSDEAEVSVLTCGVSKQVHALYGHTAIRVRDQKGLFDIVFNYGVFSFSEPNFVYRFAKGKTDYLLAPEKFQDFYKNYRRNGRSIQEQVLNLNQHEKQQLLDFLIWNAKLENREYRYNFFFDNCATRVRDAIEQEVDGEIIFPEDEGIDLTFREHVDNYQKVLPWINFGIHLTLGSPADRKASAYQEMFLPDFLMKHFAHAQIAANGVTRPLVKETRTIYEAETPDDANLNLLGPIPVLLVLFLMVVWISFDQYKTKKVSYWLDYILLFVTGLIGVVLLWFVSYSEHPAMHPNYNLWWAVPANFLFLFAWMIKSWRHALKWYWKALSVWLVLFFLFNLLIPQAFHLGFYLLTLMMLSRALLHSFLFIKARREV